MFKGLKKYIALILVLVMCLSVNTAFYGIDTYAATVKDINNKNVFLKQQSSITCTLASAAMMLRRTAICADYSEWKDITEDSIASEAWVDEVGLRWKFTVNGISVDHGYFSSLNKKKQLIELLEAYPQGFVIYNSGSLGQSHAVFLCDYDAENDVFYASDPANSVTTGRIPLSKTTMAGKTQSEKINYLNAYWYVTSPVVTYADGEYKAEKIVESGEYNPDIDVSKFNKSMQKIGEYYVVSSAQDVVMRYYPSGNADVAQSVSKGDLLYIECSGNNNFGAKWYKADNGYYIFNTNLTKLSDYSSHISKFNQTSVKTTGTYSAASAQKNSVAMRIDATEGNNIVYYIPNGTKLYIIESGFNAAGAQWLKTKDGYYVKASEMKFESSKNQSDFNLDIEFIALTGSYSAKPVENVHYSDVVQQYKVTASALNVRKAAVDGEIIGTLKNGTIVEVLDIVNNWCRIDYNGTSAWISLDYLVPVKAVDNSYAAVLLNQSSVQIGDTITCTVDYDEDCEYKYFVYSAAGNIIHSTKNYTGEKSYSFTPAKEGEYYFGVEIKSNNEKLYNIYSANFNVHAKLQLGTVSCNESKPLTGQTVTWMIETLSVSENAVYTYKLYHDGKMIDESQSSVPSYTYIPETAGEYYITVCLKDSYSSSNTVTSKIVKVNSSTATDSTLGDVNLDGNITVSDARLALRYAISLEKLSSKAILAADVTKDGKVTSSDARLILRFAVKLEDSF